MNTQTIEKKMKKLLGLFLIILTGSCTTLTQDIHCDTIIVREVIGINEHGYIFHAENIGNIVTFYSKDRITVGDTLKIIQR